MRTDHEDPTVAKKLDYHQKLLTDSDKFVNYVYHVDNARRQKYQGNLKELRLLDASGVTSSQQYADVEFQIGEYEEEQELRDLNLMAKTSQPISIKHYNFSCIGTNSCNRQKFIHVNYVNVLQEIAESNIKNSQLKTGEQLPNLAVGARRKISVQETAAEQPYEDFVQLMDFIKKSNTQKRRENKEIGNIPLNGS